MQCTATKRFLDSRGLEYTTVDVSEDADALAFIKALGYLAAPVVYTHRTTQHESGVIDGVVQHWSGNQPDRIKAIIK